MAENEKDKTIEIANNPFESAESKREFYEQNIDKYKHALDDQLSQISSDAQSKAKTGLIVLGAAAVSFWLLKKLFSSSDSGKSSKKKASVGYERDLAYNKTLYVQPQKENKLAEMIKSAIASFLLAIAKEKIANFIDNLNASNDEGKPLSNSSSTKTTTGF
jgi:hypothetical protein